MNALLSYSSWPKSLRFYQPLSKAIRKRLKNSCRSSTPSCASSPHKSYREEERRQTLDATALVHEAYVRLVGGETQRLYNDRSHFFAAAATAMRRILIDNARRKLADKHGGGRLRESLKDIATAAPDDELLALDEALEKLSAQDPLKGRLVELRYFAGLTGEQAAGVLGISPSTADRYWTYARAWLQAEMRCR